MVNASFLQELLNTLAEQSRSLIPWSTGDDGDVIALSKALVSVGGEASGVALARQILSQVNQLEPDKRKAFLDYLIDDLAPNPADVETAAAGYVANPGPDALMRLQAAVESPRQEFFRRLNRAPGAMAEILALRDTILEDLADDPRLKTVNADLVHLLASWFNPGFLVLRRIDWQTPAAILEKIIAYEAVHEITDWKDLRRRLDLNDRRCFAFFHPSLVDEPLIFVEVALCNDIPASISNVIEEPAKKEPVAQPSTAVFYSISNCQTGLRGISFGNFLIKQVVEDLARDLPSLRTFVTLSPVPGFARWLNAELAARDGSILTQPERSALAVLAEPDWDKILHERAALKPVLTQLAAYYLTHGKRGDGRPLNSVARFHLGNGARLHAVHWPADLSENGRAASYGVMVNYLYDIREIARNHEAYINDGDIAVTRSLRVPARQRDTAADSADPQPQPRPRALAAPEQPDDSGPTNQQPSERDSRIV